MMNGRCEIDLREDALLGHGSFSVVRKAQLDGHRSCAVKSTFSHIDGFEDEGGYDQFQAEVNMLSRFDNAAPIVCLLAHASEELGGGLHLVLELGRTLEEHILQQHNGALSVRDVRKSASSLQQPWPISNGLIWWHSTSSQAMSWRLPPPRTHPPPSGGS